MSLNKKLLMQITFFLILLGIFLINVELTAVNLALSAIANNFSIPIGKTSSILSLYLAFFSVFTIVGGRLGDLWGRKNISIIMLILFVSASLIGGCANNYLEILISRSLQGLSAGAILPNLTAILYNSISTEKKRHIIGITSTVVGFSTTIGPIIGSLITSYLGWRYIFFINVPLGIVITVGLFIFLNEKNKPLISLKQIDYKGILLTILLILSLMKIINLIPEITLKESLLFLFIVSILLLAWIIHHAKNDNAFLTLHFFKKKTYLIGCLIRMFLGFSYYMILYVLGIFAQDVLNFKTSFSGLIYLPMTLAITLTSLLYGRISEIVNVATLLKMGLIVFLCGVLLLLLFLNSANPIIIALIILGCAYGILYSTLFTITLHEIPENNISEASGSLYFFNLLGGTLGVSLTGVLFAIYKGKTLFQTLISGTHEMLILCALTIFISLVLSLVGIRKQHN
jgi:EmrB/QacA subfamily drug resistance transporter